MSTAAKKTRMPATKLTNVPAKVAKASHKIVEGETYRVNYQVLSKYLVDHCPQSSADNLFLQVKRHYNLTFLNTSWNVKNCDCEDEDCGHIEKKYASFCFSAEDVALPTPPPLPKSMQQPGSLEYAQAVATVYAAPPLPKTAAPLNLDDITKLSIPELLKLRAAVNAAISTKKEEMLAQVALLDGVSAGAGAEKPTTLTAPKQLPSWGDEATKPKPTTPM